MQENESSAVDEPDKCISGPHVGRKRSDTIHMKILVPSGAVGAIIGRGGESIAQVQWETGARIKLSKPSDFYPGTMERVCLIQGTLDGVTRMHNYIMDRMLEKPECAAPVSTTVPVSAGHTKVGPGGLLSSVDEPADSAVPGASGGGSLQADYSSTTAWPVTPGSRLPWGRHQQVKILVPNCTAGLVIGKLGCYVKEIKDRTRAFIQISQKSKEINLLERCITIAGDPDQCRAAVALVLAKIAEDPQSTSCPTISYSRIQGPVASAYPTGSPFAFASVSRFPTGTASSATNQVQIANMARSGTGYVSVAEPYMSPMVQAALLQAAALALNQRNYYQPATAAQAGFFNVSSSSSLQQQLVTGSISNQQHSGVDLNSAQSGASGDVGVFQSYVPPGSQQLMTSSMWPGGDSVWTGSTESPMAAPAGATLTGPAFEPHTYPTPVNFAYYPTNQSMLAPVTARHANEPFGASIDLYSTPQYAANLPIAFNNPHGLRGSSPPGTVTLASLYPGLISHPLQVCSDIGSTPSKVSSISAHSSNVPLGDLFSAMRLSGPNYSEMGPLFTAPPQYPTILNLSAYPVLSPPPGPTSALTGIPLIESAMSTAVPPSGRHHIGVISVDPHLSGVLSTETANRIQGVSVARTPRYSHFESATSGRSDRAIVSCKPPEDFRSSLGVHVDQQCTESSPPSRCDCSSSAPSSIGPISSGDPVCSSPPIYDGRLNETDRPSSAPLDSPHQPNCMTSSDQLSMTTSSSQITTSETDSTKPDASCRSQVPTSLSVSTADTVRFYSNKIVQANGRKPYVNGRKTPPASNGIAK